MRVALGSLLLAGFLVLGASAATADTFTLTVTSQTSSTITFSYPQQAGYGYLYSANGVVVSRTNDPAKTSIRFSKNAANSYDVDSLVKGANGHCCSAVPPPPPPPVASITQNISSGVTLSGTFAWRGVYDGNGDGVEDDPGSVRFLVDGVQVLSEINPPFGDTDGFWDSATVANGTHTFRVDAVNDAGTVVASNAVTAMVSNTPTPPPTPPPPPPPSGSFPDASNTGTPPGTLLHTCSGQINTTGTYDKCQFDGPVVVNAANVHITNSLILGPVRPSDTLTGLVISDTTINCQCLSTSDDDTPVAIMENNFTLLRVNIYNAGHGVSAKNNVTVQDSYIHGLGGNTQAHKNGIFVGDGHHQRFIHNNVECNDGPDRGCTAAIGIYDDFSDVYDVVIDNNLLNTNGAYCFYASGGPSKDYISHNITFTNNHFGRKFEQNCAVLGPVTYWDASQPGMVWSGNVWDDTGQPVKPQY